MVVVLALAFFLQESLILLALIFIFNVWFCYKVGVYAVRALVFPFSSSLIQNSINGQSGLRYSEDFATLLEKTYVLIRLTQRLDDSKPGNMEPAQMSLEARKVASGFKLISNREYFSCVHISYTIREAHAKLKSLTGVISLYSETNQQVIDRLTSSNGKLKPLFMESSEILSRINSIF